MTQKHRITKQAKTKGNKRRKQTKRQLYKSAEQGTTVKNQVTVRKKLQRTEQTGTQYKENNTVIDKSKYTDTMTKQESRHRNARSQNLRRRNAKGQQIRKTILM